MKNYRQIGGKKAYLFILFSLSMLMIQLFVAVKPALSRVLEQNISASTVKAAYLLRFFDYVVYANESRIDEYRIAVLGSPQGVYEELNDAVRNYRAKGKPVSVELTRSLRALGQYQLVFIPQDSNVRLSQVYQAIRGTDTLLITDQSLERRYFMLNLKKKENDTISFEVNRSNIILEGMSIDSTVLLLGGTELDVAELLGETEAELLSTNTSLQKLEEERSNLTEIMEKQRAQLAQLESRFDELESTLKTKNEEIQLKDHQIESNKKELEVQRKNLDEAQENLANTEATLSERQIQMEYASKELARKEAEVAKQAQQIADNQEALRKQTAVLKENQQTIDNQSQALLSAGDKLDLQRQYLIVGSILIVVFVILTVIILSMYRSRNEAHRQISAKNKELIEAANQVSMLSRALQQSQVSVLMTDVKGQIQYVNPAFTSRTGLTEEEVLTRRINDLDFDSVILEKLNSIQEVVVKKGSWKGELYYLDKQGNAVWELCTVTSVTDVNDEVNHYLAVNEDITELKSFERQLVEATRAANSANQAKSDFLATMSHEIRTPMNAIIGMTHLLGETNLSAKQTGYKNKIDMAAHSLLHIINDILDFSKVEAGELSIENIEFSMNDVLENLSGIVANKAMSKSLELVFDIDVDIPQKLMGDPLRIGQILINLLGNAIKFTNEGNVTLTIKVLPGANGNIGLEFIVKDTGIGMSEDELAQVFQPFQQADSSITRKFGGSGLGLTISERLAGLMGGTLSASSVKGQGSEFTLSIRLALPENSEQSQYQYESMLNDVDVVVCEPMEGTRVALTKLLTQFGCKVTEFDDYSAMLVHLANPAKGRQHVFIHFDSTDDDSIKSFETLMDNRKNRSLYAISSTERSNMLSDWEQDGKIKAIVTKPLTPSVIHDALLMQVHQHDPSISTAKHTTQEWSEENRGALVLLVEDNELNQDVAVELLSNVGLSVQVAVNGEEAVRMVERTKYDVVLMDLHMPVMDGFESTQKIREKYSADELPIIAMTANARAEDKAACLEKGMNDYISKPIKVSILYKTLNRWLGEHTGEIHHQEKTSEEPLPQAYAKLVTIDVPAAMEVVDQNLALLNKLFAKFLESQSNLYLEFETARKQDDKSTMIRVAHTFKNVAANIGATELRAHFIELEELCRAGTDKEAIDVNFDKASQLIEPVVTEVTRLLESIDDNKGVPVDDDIPSGDDVDLLTELQHCLENHDTDALLYIRKILSVSDDNRLINCLTELESHVQNYDFKHAKDDLRDYMSNKSSGEKV